MCCPTSGIDKSFKGNIQLEVEGTNLVEKKIHVHGEINIDSRPKSVISRFTLIFQRLELIEKVTEIIDESFHLLGTALKLYANPETHRFFKDIHYGAHKMERLLHALCIVGDFSRILEGKFLEYDLVIRNNQEIKRLNLLRTAARICHLASHLLATLSLLSDLKVIPSTLLRPILKYQLILSVTGYGLWIISLLSKYYQTKSEQKQLIIDLGIYLGGVVYEGLPLLVNHCTFLHKYSPLIQVTHYLSTLAGIISAGCVVSRLTPRNQEKLKIKKVTFTLRQENSYMMSFPLKGHVK